MARVKTMSGFHAHLTNLIIYARDLPGFEAGWMEPLTTMEEAIWTRSENERNEKRLAALKGEQIEIEDAIEEAKNANKRK